MGIPRESSQSGLSTADMANAAARQPDAATVTSISHAQPLQQPAQDRTDSQRGGAVYSQRSGDRPVRPLVLFDGHATADLARRRQRRRRFVRRPMRQPDLGPRPKS